VLALMICRCRLPFWGLFYECFVGRCILGACPDFMNDEGRLRWSWSMRKGGVVSKERTDYMVACQLDVDRTSRLGTMHGPGLDESDESWICAVGTRRLRKFGGGLGVDDTGVVSVWHVLSIDLFRMSFLLVLFLLRCIIGTFQQACAALYYCLLAFLGDFGLWGRFCLVWMVVARPCILGHCFKMTCVFNGFVISVMFWVGYLMLLCGTSELF